MIEIPLTKGYVTIVDDEDADLAQFKWYALETTASSRVYAYRAISAGKNKRRTIYLHRAVLERVCDYELPSGSNIDHKDGDGLNNTRGNLRTATHKENMMNRRRSASNTSGLKGVWWSKYSSKWEAAIRVDGKSVRLGRFHSQIEGHKAYCIAALKYHKEFANFGASSPFTREDLIDLELPPKQKRGRPRTAKGRSR